jgi:hypothetical protein
MSLHPNRLKLERFSVSDLPEAERAQVAEHTSSCPACRAYLDELDAARVAGLARMPAAEFLARLPSVAGATRRRLGRTLPVTVAVTATVMTAALAWMLVPRVEPPRTGVRFKGAAVGVSLYRSRGGEVASLDSAEARIRARDALRVVVRLPRPEQVGVWFVDADSRIDRFLDRPVLVGAGEHALEGSATVDSPCKDLWVVVAIGAAVAGSTEAELRRALGHGRPDDGGAWAPSGTWTRLLRCE